MLRRFCVVFAGCALLVGFPAEARFGKGGSRSGSSGSSSSHSHSSGPAGSSSSSSSGSSYSGNYSSGYGYYRPSWSLGFGFVPAYRYHGYGYGFRDYGYAPSAVVAEEPTEQPSNPIRVSAGAEAAGFVTGRGFTLGAAASVEGDRWGFAVTGMNITVRADDGTSGFDNLQVATAHLTFAFLTGQYGRLRLEGGADAVFAPNLITVGPTVGLSSVIWIGGPFALEGSLMVTPWPFTQVDAKAGAAVGVGPVGFRAGFRAQLLNDRGVVDGVVHQDIFLGPYVGVAFVF